MAIQLDFGGFDPSFIGVTIRFGNDRAWQIFDAFSKSANPPSLIGLPRDERFEALSITSVVSHEIRHFHDFLLTAYSAQVFRLRVQALVNLLEVLFYISKSDANCLPVPLSEWCRLDDTGRKEYLSWLPQRKDNKPWSPVELPFVDDKPFDFQQPTSPMSWSPETVERLIRAAIYTRERIHEFTYNPRTVRGTTSFQPWQIFELSGFLIQMQDIWYTYGAKDTQIFMEYLQTSENPYGLMLKLAADMWWRAGLPFDAAMTSAVVAWSLMGSYERDGWQACPTERFMLLWEHISKHGLYEAADDLMELFNAWSRALKVSTVEEGLAETQKIYHRLRTSIESRLLNISGSFVSENYGELILRVVDSVARASEHMIEQFRESPDTYVRPYLYINNANSFVNPVLRMVSEGGGLQFSLPMNELEKAGYSVRWAAIVDNKELIFSIIAPYNLSKHIYFDPAEVSHLSELIGVTDFLFAETDRAHAEVQRPGRSFFQNTEKIPVEVLH